MQNLSPTYIAIYPGDLITTSIMLGGKDRQPRWINDKEWSRPSCLHQIIYPDAIRPAHLGLVIGSE